ncbi:sensor histidine kinase [Paenarthrobacter nicotinovorans]|uniref:sensor histidine kinase n=1 Tax=Paenarthrobacter nicotinovorans TaxID=29320 RepID=UPI003811FB21
MFVLVIVLHIVVLAACILLPWKRLGPGSFLVVPVADCVIVALMREAAGPVLSVVGLLMTFPVIWLSVSTDRTRVALAVLAPLASTITAPFITGEEVERSELIRMVVFPVIMAGLALTGHAVARGLMAHRERTHRKDLELIALHEKTKVHEQLLDTVLETIGVGVWVMDASGNDILTNRRLRADRSWADERTGQTSNPFTIGNRENVDGDASPAVLAAAGVSFTNRLIRIGSGDAPRTFSVAARPLRDDAARLRGSVLAFTDVTALVKAQTARDKFVAAVSHELRTPLTSILGYLELLKNGENTKFMDIIERNAKRLLMLVNDLLMVASEELELRCRPTQLGSLLQDSVKQARSEAAVRDIKITLRVDGDTAVDVDPVQLSKALDQLLSNAIKFSPPNSQVSVDLQGNDTGAELTVRDEGVGMTEQEQEEAFTKFFRADHAIGTAIPGAGLGLPLSKAIIEAHGGTISLASRPGNGTTVRVTLPS